MRFTLCLRKQNLGWWFKKNWKEQSERQLIQIRVPQKLIDDNVPIPNAADVTRPKRPFTKYVIPEPWNFPQSEKPTGEDHPDWHDTPCYFYKSDTSLLEGVPHVQNLVGALLHKGLPPRLQEAYDRINVEEWEDSLRSFTENALLHDGYQSKLPKIIDKERPWYNFMRPYGIPKDRKIRLLLNSLIRIADMAAVKDLDVLTRDLVTNASASTTLRKDEKFVQFCVDAALMLTSHEPLEPFANEMQVFDTAQEILPDMYPVISTMDLKEENIYQVHEFLSIPTGLNQQFVHTLFLHNNFPDEWDHSKILASAIGTCHGFALAQAKRLFGHKAKKLPHPVTLQCIQTDSKTFNFVAYQLNTMEHGNAHDRIKNMVWVDDSRDLYDRCEKVDFINYMELFNSDILRRFFAFYFNGLTV